MRYEAASVVTDRQTHTHTHKQTTVTLAHAPRVKYTEHSIMWIPDSRMFQWILPEIMDSQINFNLNCKVEGGEPDCPSTCHCFYVNIAACEELVLACKTINNNAWQAQDCSDRQCIQYKYSTSPADLDQCRSRVSLLITSRIDRLWVCEIS